MRIADVREHLGALGKEREVEIVGVLMSVSAREMKLGLKLVEAAAAAE